MGKAPVDITPKNGSSFPWNGQDSKNFLRDWDWKPVQLTGFFQHEDEIKVEKFQNGEKGVEIITPFYTHVSNKDVPQGILVNRGWMPADL